MNKNKAPLMVIFETDLGNDVDDALAMDMLYKYSDDGLVKVLAINSNKLSPYSYGMIDIMNKWYGYPAIPFGKVDKDGQDTSYNFAKAVCEFKVNGKPVFQPSLADNVEKATQVYRRILSKQPDQSVIIISTGFSTNLAKLLETKGDKYSKLSGLELISKKVKLLSVMAGNFEDPDFKEYNVVEDIPAAQKVFSSWPTPLVCSPFELGEKINYPGSSIANDFKWTPYHPMVIAYENYIKMPYDRPTWDLTSVLYAVEGRAAYFTESEKGKISVDARGVTHFKADAKGQHQYIKANKDQQELIKTRFLELITRKPKNLQ